MHSALCLAPIGPHHGSDFETVETLTGVLVCSEETECRFCTNTLPDWRKALEDKPRAAPLMTVSHDGEVHVLKVSQRKTEEILQINSAAIG